MARLDASSRGVAVGGVAGAALGSEVAGGASKGGVIGCAAGGLAGRQIARDQSRGKFRIDH